MIDSNNFWERRKQNYYLLIELHWISLFLIISYIISYIWFYEKFWRLFSSSVPVIVYTFILSFLMEFRYKYKSIYGKDLNITVNNLIFLFILFSFHTYTSIRSDINSIEDQDAKTEISFRYQNKDIKSTNQFRFLGQTKNFMIFYDKSLKQTKFFERSNVVDIVVTNLR